MKVIPKEEPNSIPARKVPANAYSGRGFDTVGPSNYDPKFDNSKPVAP